jgi:HSP20 family molecular chaperone IbpA
MPSLVGRASFAPMADMFGSSDAYLVNVEVPRGAHESSDVEISERELVIKVETVECGPAVVLRRGAHRTVVIDYRGDAAYSPRFFASAGVRAAGIEVAAS